jgi:hypothetical protein
MKLIVFLILYRRHLKWYKMNKNYKSHSFFYSEIPKKFGLNSIKSKSIPVTGREGP